MRRYLVFIILSLVLVVTSILIIRSLKTPPRNNVPTSVNNIEFNNLHDSDSSISDYFKEEFERRKDSSEITGGIKKDELKTCELFGKVVSQGTAVYDSTCVE